MFAPDFQITPALTKVLMDIEASRQAVSSLPVTVPVLTSLRESARLLSIHYSTQIEGNRLTREQVEDVIHGGTFHDYGLWIPAHPGGCPDCPIVGCSPRIYLVMPS